MLEIYVDSSGDDYPQCPLRSDLNTCEAVEGSDVNSCPSLSEDGAIWTLPDWCPLRDGGVCVQFKEEDEDDIYPAPNATLQGSPEVQRKEIP